MERMDIPKLITSEVIEAVTSNEEQLKSLFHLNDEEGFINNNNSKIAWNTKMLKFILCDVQIYLKNKEKNEQFFEDKNKTTMIKSPYQIQICVSELPNKKLMENYNEKIQEMKKTIDSLNKDIEEIKSLLNFGHICESNK
ncbi:hypothetical protein [Clostridiisalibacter paucivorans]|uniref:hypothetical protein n=1 Tax=Clostridiisalibacter paucivorans TaxID=408753 RepID=UPI0004791BBC|nr:hypothetical protein [Clostridiisalibacter paucivorans]